MAKDPADVPVFPCSRREIGGAAIKYKPIPSVTATDLACHCYPGGRAIVVPEFFGKNFENLLNNKIKTFLPKESVLCSDAQQL